MQGATSKKDGSPVGRLMSLPKTYFLIAAGISLVLSIYAWFCIDREIGLFVGIWVPSICSAGSLVTGGRHE